MTGDLRVTTAHLSDGAMTPAESAAPNTVTPPRKP